MSATCPRLSSSFIPSSAPPSTPTAVPPSRNQPNCCDDGCRKIDCVKSAAAAVPQVPPELTSAASPAEMSSLRATRKPVDMPTPSPAMASAYTYCERMSSPSPSDVASAAPQMVLPIMSELCPTL